MTQMDYVTLLRVRERARLAIEVALRNEHAAACFAYRGSIPSGVVWDELVWGARYALSNLPMSPRPDEDEFDEDEPDVWPEGTGSGT